MSSAVLVGASSTGAAIWEDEFYLVDFDDVEDVEEPHLSPLARLHAGGQIDGETLAPPASDVPSPGADLRTRFEVLATELADATRVLSSTRRAMDHPAYVEILGLGTAVIPFLVERLHDDEGDRPLWLRLLGSLTTGQPSAGQETVETAAAEWVRRAKRDGLV